MSRRDWALVVADIQQACFTQIRELSMPWFATLKSLVKPPSIPDDKKLLKPEIDWAAIRGLRNRFVHETFGLSLSVIWAIVQTDLPVLAQQLSAWPIESR
jgi:hypothetical protein